MATSNKAVIQRIVEDIFNRQQHDLVDELYDLKCCGSDPAVEHGQIMGTDQLKGLLTTYRRAFPDHIYEIVDLLEDGDKVAMRWRVKGTHTGPLGQLQPTGNPLRLKALPSAESRMAAFNKSGNNGITWALWSNWGRAKTKS